MASPTSWGSWSYSSLTGNSAEDSLFWGTQWSSGVITYSFASNTSFWSTSSLFGYGASTGVAEPWVNMDWLNASQQASARSALAAWAAVANLSFIEVTDNANTAGDIRFGFASTDTHGYQAWGYYPGPSTKGGDVWFSSGQSNYGNLWPQGSYQYETALHELGHALGLKHPFEASGLNDWTLATSLESRSYTVMSYQAGVGLADTYFSYEPTTPMLLDIEAIQHLYGPNLSFNASNTTYTFGTSLYNQTIWDAGGTDWISDVSSIGRSIDLRQGYGSQLGAQVYVRNAFGADLFPVKNVWIAYGTWIENASGGGGNDSITGNELANILQGGAGNDTINGGFGDDAVNGDAGNDLLDGEGGNDVLDGGAGIDTALFSFYRSNYQITHAGTTNVHTFVGDGETDTLSNVERISFLDISVAYDLSGSAGTSAKLIGAIFGASYVHNPYFVGAGIGLLDSNPFGTPMTPAQVAEVAIGTSLFLQLAGSHSNTDFVKTVYENLIGVQPSASELAYYLGFLDSGTLSQAQLAVAASVSSWNLANIDITGLAQTGIDFQPLV